MLLHLLFVVSRKIPLGQLVEGNQDGHDFTQAQSTRPLAALQAVVQQTFFPLGLKALAEIIDVTEQVF
ncbi:MAG: hypothetical protein Kow00121_31530 [Elainellaceae cyanobacterium]